jgi:hypothetical protein
MKIEPNENHTVCLGPRAVVAWHHVSSPHNQAGGNATEQCGTPRGKIIFDTDIRTSNANIAFGIYRHRSRGK